jgi:hypothetical protein
MENFEVTAFVLGCIGTLCWAVCFWWMHRISSRQNAMLEELHEVTKRIEKLSQAEHDLMSDVHPQVSEIKEHVQNVEEAVSPVDRDYRKHYRIRRNTSNENKISCPGPRACKDTGDHLISLSSTFSG